MDYHFDIEDAKKYGVEPAVLLYNLKFWICKNKANKKHFYESRTWTYNSQAALLKLFPFWSRQNLRTIIKKLIDGKEIRIGDFNKAAYDRTTWFALEDESTLGWNQPVDGRESTKQSVKTNQPIPDINTDIKTDNTPAELNDYQKVIEAWWEGFKKKYGENPQINGRTGRDVKALLKAHGVQVVVECVELYLNRDDLWFTKDKLRDFGKLVFHFNELLSLRGQKDPERDRLVEKYDKWIPPIKEKT